MTLYEYELLGGDVQACILWEHGVHLATRTTLMYEIELYQLESFYVEAFYHRIRGELHCLKAFAAIEQLTPYLNQISLAGIL